MAVWIAREKWINLWRISQQTQSRALFNHAGPLPNRCDHRCPDMSDLVSNPLPMPSRRRPYRRGAENVEGRASQGQELGSEGLRGVGTFQSLVDPPHMYNLQRETFKIKNQALLRAHRRRGRQNKPASCPPTKSASSKPGGPGQVEVSFQLFHQADTIQTCNILN